MLGILGVLAFVISHWSESLNWDAALPGLQADPAQFLTLALVAVIIPSLAEEFVFRGLLQPKRLSGLMSYAICALSLILFILWHPIQVWTRWFTGQAVFMDPGFLVVAGMLGLACTISVHRSGSIWGAVAMHWIVVVVWKAGV